MFERASLQFTLLFADMEAKQQAAAEMRPGHLLLGLRLAPREPAGRLLAHIPIEHLRSALAPRAHGDNISPGQREIPRSADTERLLRLAADEAAALGGPVTPEHLLLALFADAGCARVLAEGGVSETALRNRLTARAETPVRLTVGESPHPALALAPYDPARHQPFAWILTQEHLAGLANLAVVLTNTSAQRVTGLVTRWTLVDDDGETRIRTNIVDDYFVYNRFRSLAAGRHVLLTPRGCTEPFSPTDHWCCAGGLERSEATTVAATVEIDSAIFEDGRIAGADSFAVGAYIHGRHAAAIALMEAVQAAAEAGEDRTDALERLTWQMHESRRTSGHRQWHFPSHNPTWLEQLRQLPAPPAFAAIAPKDF